MKITPKDLDAAADAGIVDRKTADALWRFFQARPSTRPRFDLTHVLYYMGGLIAMGAMTVFMNLGWESFGGWGIFFISLAYGAGGLKLAGFFRKKGYAVPAGICGAFTVALTPLAIYGLMRAMGWWPDASVYKHYHMYVRWHWIFMELGTLAMGAIVVYVYRYPFLLMPVAVTLWYMSMDLASMITGGPPNWDLRTLVSLFFGLVMILIAFWVDVRAHRKGDFAFWLYLFGVLAFWGGLTFRYSDNELSKFLYFLMNLAMMGVGVLIVRRVFVVFGAIGVSIYLGHLAKDVFSDSWLFPAALTAIGLGWWARGCGGRKTKPASPKRPTA